ncbi:apolipoprotein N-acyltransferase [Rhodococcus sp. 15-725-2-2b]|nr:apolipoprotein N-acyltransferase [Rhodococcus sp. WWJCD1]OZC60521.1 apolipoprotein N-acyltransferase [Rhodococcus sp. 06-469-3-2]OZD40954.1 apolipoprotein N-acyltransferase [Rhodococcus sp. 06-1477-1A]OZE66375.1 apolipoprotein N-acyltransferase [Rhodococcus sp. 15-725-2-2b]OZE89227.1 apolipoprotein N-acyltransferase [Rhodococcus sp. 15-2388-1-1a]
MRAAPDIEPGPRPLVYDPSRARWVTGSNGVRAWIRLFAAAWSGLMLYATFPPIDLWFLAPVAIAMLLLAVRGRGTRAGAGFVAGSAFFVPLLPWVGEYVGSVPWLALAVVQALFVAMFGAVADRMSRLPWAPVWVASAWVAIEAARSRVPFGGFPWGRIAFGQSDGPLLPLAALIGAPGLSFVVVLIGSALAGAIASDRITRRTAAASCIGAATAVGALTVVAPLFAPPPQDTVTVALVQGNVPRLGLDFNAQRRAVLDNHVQRTIELADDIDSGRVRAPDLVVWPENSSDIDPLRNPDAAARIDAAARAVGVPVLVGTVLRRDDGTTSNTSIVWDPVTGPGQMHDKRRLVPFGEYLPMRTIVTALSPYAAQAGRFVPGQGNGVLDLAGVPVAVATCYEVAFDALLTDSVRAGAQLIAVPTNNATFGRTNMTYQQLAMSRVRAVEHGRSVVVSATSGVSAVIDARGEVVERTELFTPAAVVTEVSLSTTLTPATITGSVPEWIAATGAVAALAFSLLRRPRSTTPNPSTTMSRSI